LRLEVSRASTAAALGGLAVALGAYLWIPQVGQVVDPAVRALSAPEPHQAIGVLRDYLLGFGPWAPVVSAALMMLQAVVAPLPAFVITLANGLLFGWAWGALLSWSSATLAAALCFGMARALGRPAVERLLGGAAVLDAGDRFFQRHGKLAIVLARLLPFVPFDPISYGAGLTSTRFWPFLLATGLGQLPATLFYSYLGERLTGPIWDAFLIASIVAAVVVAGWVVGRRWLVRRGAG
jgi:uncharacterized membrane protein YdjX (TVP38/TMEM64 family)